MIQVYQNNGAHLKDFIELNNVWIIKYFAMEDADLELAQDPAKIIKNGGYILTLTDEKYVVGACALFKNDDDVYELARMAVLESRQGQGIGNLLMKEILALATMIKVKKLFLVSNTKLEAAISLYKKFGFKTVFEGQHPSYKRGNIIMEKFIIEAKE
jgi:N-acetylglutamate synthase-like GNAT family acetyltransferase